MAAPGTVAVAGAGAGNKPWAAGTGIGVAAVVVPDIVESGTAAPGIVEVARIAAPVAPRTEQRVVGNIVVEELEPASREQLGGCNARPYSTRWGPHGTDRHPLLLEPRAGWQSSSAHRWLMVGR